MVSFSSELLQTWVISLLWPLTRILAVIATAPILSHASIPVRAKLGIGICITLVVVPTLPPLPQFEIFSFQGLLLLAQQLVIGVAIGLLVSIFQAATQINEATLSFIPKLLGVFAVLIVAGPWMLTTMVDYMLLVFTSIPNMAN